MVFYDLSHLTQDDAQIVDGPIQDDEALVLYGIIRTKRMRRILEFGGLNGYSARNFLAAVGLEGIVYTIDIMDVPKLAPNHVVLKKDVKDVDACDLDNLPVELVFFDCHADGQMAAFMRLRHQGIITDDTVLVLHDTNLHYHSGEPRVHQPVERNMVGMFKLLGYDAVCLHTGPDKHDATFPLRHGLTLCMKFQGLDTNQAGDAQPVDTC